MIAESLTQPRCFGCCSSHSSHPFVVQDKVTGQHQGFGFVEFLQEWDAEYAHKVMAGVKLYGKPIRCNKASSASRKGVAAYDVGANLFVGNLSPEVDERMLYDTFSRFGIILSTPKVMRDPETNEPKGFAFVCFSDFDASDAAIASLNGMHMIRGHLCLLFWITEWLSWQGNISRGVPLMCSTR